VEESELGGRKGWGCGNHSNDEDGGQESSSVLKNARFRRKRGDREKINEGRRRRVNLMQLKINRAGLKRGTIGRTSKGKRIRGSFKRGPKSERGGSRVIEKKGDSSPLLRHRYTVVSEVND